MTFNATFEALKWSRRSSPTWLLAKTSLFPLVIIRFPTILILPFQTLAERSTLPTILIINPTLVNQFSKTGNLLVTNSLLDVMSQAIHKLQAFRSLSISSIVVGTILYKLLKFSSINSNSTISLLQLKEFHLFLPTTIFRKIVLQEVIT